MDSDYETWPDYMNIIVNSILIWILGFAYNICPADNYATLTNYYLNHLPV